MYLTYILASWMMLLVISCPQETHAAVDYTELVPLPSGLRNQDGLTYLSSSTMTRIFPTPCPFRTTCQTVTNANLKKLIATESVGPFRVTGLTPAMDRLRMALSRVQQDLPELYAQLGTAGMLCCRAVRGSSSSYSNHAWGAAIDFTINGQLDPRADGKTQRGLLLLYPYMHDAGFFWAAGYSAAYEDAMHFEIAEQTMSTWAADGTLADITGPTISECSWPVLSQQTPLQVKTEVFTLQYLLINSGSMSTSAAVDGLFGSGTTSAVQAFQRSAGLVSDGIVGRNTWTSLWNSATLSTSSPVSYQVRAVQDLLNRRHGAGLVVDGDFGARSRSAVIAFQNDRSFTATGSIALDDFKGLLTWCLGPQADGTPGAEQFQSNTTSCDNGGCESLPEDNTPSSDSNKVLGLGRTVVIIIAVLSLVILSAVFVILRRRRASSGGAPLQPYELMTDPDPI